MDEAAARAWALCPKYLLNLFRAWKTDDNHCGNQLPQGPKPAVAAAELGPCKLQGYAGAFPKLSSDVGEVPMSCK